MWPGRTRLACHDRLSSQRPCTAQNPKSNCSPKRRMLRPPMSLATRRVSCFSNHEFAPTPNPFSILAELEQPTTQAKWAFDFVQTPGNVSSRRGKRAGKHNKLKHASKNSHDARTNNDVGKLCDQVAALGLNHGSTNSASRNGPPPYITTVTHHGAPQFRPENNVETNNPFLYISQAEPALTQVEADRPTDGETTRPFPFSAFLATPSPTARRATMEKSTQPARPEFTRQGAKPPVVMPPELAQKETASPSFPAPASQTSDPATFPDSKTAPVRPSPLPSSLAQFSGLENFATMADTPPIMASPFVPLSTTPLRAASPRLTTTPLTGTPSPRASPLSPLLPESGRLPERLSVPSSPIGRVPYYSGGLPPALQSGGAVNSSRHSRFSKHFESLPRSTSSMSVETFLEMGHASPCWCSRSSHPSPHPDLTTEVAHEESLESPMSRTTRLFDAIEVSELKEYMESLRLTRPKSAGAQLEGLGSGMHRTLTSTSDDSDETWTIVSAGDDRYKTPDIPAPAAQDTMSDLDIISVHTSSPGSTDNWSIQSPRPEKAPPAQSSAKRAVTSPLAAVSTMAPPQTPAPTPLLPSTPTSTPPNVEDDDVIVVIEKTAQTSDPAGQITSSEETLSSWSTSS